MCQSRPTVKAACVLGAGATLLLPSLPAWSAAFALQEQSASRLGTAFAGSGSAADDASTIFYNVGGLGFLEQPEVLVVLSGIGLQTEFDNDASLPALGQPLGGEGGDAGGWHAVPSVYAAFPLSEQFKVGLAVNAPFGLVTDWDSDFMGRFQALRSDIQTINVAPSIAWRPTKQWSFGVGLNYQTIDAELTNAINYSAVVGQGLQQLVLAGQLPPALVPTLLAANAGLEGRTKLEGDDEAWGFNVGVIFEPVEGTRLGLSYRSKYTYDVEGTVRFSAPAATNATGAAIIAAASASGGPLSNQPVTVDLTLPELATASVTQELGAFTMMADLSWQRWSQIQELRVLRENGATLSVTPEEWEDTWRINVGGEWEMSDAWALRAGVAYDESAVPDDTRTPRLPDSDRIWVSLGAQWRASDAVVLDAGYAHLFADEGPSEQGLQDQPAAGVLNGEYEAAVDIVSVQVAYRF
jgi:long-chain fatty acid transport protein